MTARAVYVYYRVRAEDAHAAVAAARGLHARWRREYAGLACALMRREDEREPAFVTLMEIFSAPAGVPREQQAAIESASHAALAPWLVGERHAEVFVPCA